MKVGFRFYFDVYDDTNENRDKTQTMKYTNLTLTNQSNLKDLYFPLLSKRKNLLN